MHSLQPQRISKSTNMKQQSYLAKLLWLMVWMWLCVMITFVKSQGRDTLEPGQGLRDWEFLESSGKKFQFRFFSPDFTTNRYLGIQFVPDLAKFVWVANRDRPFKDTSAVLNLTRDGILVINYNSTSFTINSDQQAIDGTRNIITLRLLDSGNLVLRSGQQVIWQSFDYPTDTLLPGMKLGLFDLKDKQPRQKFLTSWLTPSLPASGAFTFGVDPNNTKQLVIWRRGTVYWQSGNWNRTRLNFRYGTGMNSSYFPENIDENQYKFTYTSNENESYFTLSMAKEDLSARIAINLSGSFDFFAQTSSGGAEWYQSDVCDTRNPYVSWGCVRVNQTNCSKGDEFFLTSGTMSAWSGYADQSLGISDCKEICRKDCSCNAYTSKDSDGTGCMFSDETKLEENYASETGFFYIRNTTVLARVADPPIEDLPRDNVTDKEHPRKRILWEFLGPLISVAILGVCVLFCYQRRRYLRNGDNSAGGSSKHAKSAIINELQGLNLSRYSGSKDQNLPSFSFSTLQCATSNFSIEHKLGQGGFGPVYKGVLENGQEIAVKRLSQSSGQGINEFKNEVLLISKLQHRNLVRLLGCCIQGEEKLLVYEYMPNKSLDSSLFDVKNQLSLDWGKRFCIIEGIAQGLLYLHKHSRLRIIHRDLKTSNILLDAELNPKISDFGLARTFKDNESRGNTRNIAGTCGYMSPEYAMGGLFSVKSDVFSFGVMVLEIISGKKNASFYHCGRFFNLLGYAWELWKQERAVELMDPRLAETSTPEVARCVHIGLLCVQENAVDRPTMSDVVSMLNYETIVLPVPKQPAFSTVVGVNEEEAVPCSINDVTVSDFEAR